MSDLAAASFSLPVGNGSLYVAGTESGASPLPRPATSIHLALVLEEAGFF